MGAVLNFIDKLQNALTGTGTTRDPRTRNTYAAYIPLTQQQIANAYGGSGMMRKIVNIPALDIVREWRDWKLEADQIAAVEAEENRLAVRQKIRQAEVLRRMGGGALILGLPGELGQPAPKTVTKGQLAFLHVVSRWHLTYDRLESDAREAGYGEPEMWRLSTGSGQIEVHPSRVIPFRGDTTMSLALPAMSAQDEFWGESVIQHVLDAVTDNDAARAAFSSLLTKARTLRIGIPKLMDLVATKDGEALLQTRLATLALAESIHNAFIYDAGGGETGKGGESIEDAKYDFTGAKDILNTFGEFVSAISDIPATRLLGRSPEGMNSSGESQQADWRKKVRAMQTLDLAPCLDRLDRYLVPSAIGLTPEGTWYEFAPLDTPGEKELAEIFKTKMEAVEKLQLTGSIPDQAFARGVQSMMIDDGYLPELEQALAEIPEAERWGIVQSGSEPAPNPDALQDAKPRTLYVSRKLLNAGEFLEWARGQGFGDTLAAEDLHVTIAYSRRPVDWMEVETTWEERDGTLVVPPGGARLVEPLGDKGAVVLLFSSSQLSWRHEQIKRSGATWDWPEFQPHVTIAYSGEGVDLNEVEPYRGELRFGPEIFEEVDEGWTPQGA